MDCPQLPETQEFLRHFNRKVTEQRIPIAGSLDLTNRCNLRCIHCYLGERRWNGKELETAAWHKIIDDITDAGCLYLLLSGGEPLLRKDFTELYRHARTNGLIVTVFTNATRIHDEHLELFMEFPPRLVELSLYGATAETYERVTGVPGSFEQCLRGLQKLLDLQFPVGLKTILMTVNQHEIAAMERLAESYGVKFRLDAAIFSGVDENKAPVELRVSPEDAIEVEFSNPQRAQAWEKFFHKWGKNPSSEFLYRCGAGLTMFHITADGFLQPCLMTQTFQYPLTQGNFLDGWLRVIPQIREKKAPPYLPCRHCEKIFVCGYCPAFFYLEHGAEDVPVDYLCHLGEQRFHRLVERNEPVNKREL